METLFSLRAGFLNLVFKALTSRMRDLEKENLFLKHQLIILKRQVKRPKITKTDRTLLCHLSSGFRNWQESLLIVKPSTLLAWHRKLAQWKWTTQFYGRPKLDPKIKDLIIQMKRENSLWGPKRIHGEFIKLGIKVSESTIRTVLRNTKLNPWDGSSAGTWREFILRHKNVWAMDFFTVHSASFKRIFVWVLMDIHSRKLIATHITSHPSSEFVKNALAWELAETSEMPAAIIRDRDPAFDASSVTSLFKENEIKNFRCPSRSPMSNAHVERLNGTIQRECTDHFLFFTEGQLKRTLDEYQKYYNHSRCHQGINQKVPIPRRSSISSPKTTNKLRTRKYLSGLHHEYFWAA